MKTVRFYVYVDRRNDDEPFYVGRGRLNRTKDFSHHNRRWHEIVDQHGVSREILLETMDEQASYDKEVELIFSLKTRDYLGGANVNDGGRDLCLHTKPVKEVLSVLSRNRLGSEGERLKASEKFSRMWHDDRDRLMETHIRGMTHHKAKLTNEDVYKVRSAYKEIDTSIRGEISSFYRKWSLDLGVTPENLFRIVHRKSWTHLP